MSTDFQSKAQLAAAKVQSLNPAEGFALSLTCDRPTIDNAVKSFLSLTAARSLASSDPNNILLRNNNGISDAKDKLQDIILNTLPQESLTVAKSVTSSDQNDTLLMTTNGNSNTNAKDKRQGVILNTLPQEKCFFIKSKNPRQAALLCARVILKTVNSFQIPETKEKSEEEDITGSVEVQVVRILWNGLMNAGKKPSMILGRLSLCHVYPLILDTLKSTLVDGVDPLEVIAFMEEFGKLLTAAAKRSSRDVLSKKDELLEKMNEKDDDSCLLWDIDSGAAELDRRKHRRTNNASVGAKILSEKGSDDDLPMVELISRGDETEDDS